MGSRMAIGRFEVKESGPHHFPSLDVRVGGKLVGKIDCVVVENRVKARRQETADNTLMITEADIEWALKNALMESKPLQLPAE